MNTTTDLGFDVFTLMPVVVVVAVIVISNIVKVWVYAGKPTGWEAKWFDLVPFGLGLLYGVGEFFLGYTKGSLALFPLMYSIVKQAFGYGGASALVFRLTKPFMSKVFTEPPSSVQGIVTQAIILGKVTQGTGE